MNQQLTSMGSFPLLSAGVLSYSSSFQNAGANSRREMAHTIFILGTDTQQCKELREILQERVAETIVTSSSSENVPSIHSSDTVILTSEEERTGTLYRRLLNRLEEEVNRARFLGDLIRLFSSS